MMFLQRADYPGPARLSMCMCVPCAHCVTVDLTLVLRSALSFIGIVIAAALLGALLFAVVGFFLLPDVPLIPLPVALGLVAVLTVLAGFFVGLLGSRWWPVAVIASWPFAIIGLGMLPLQPLFGLGWLGVPLVLTLLGSYLGVRYRSAKSR